MVSRTRSRTNIPPVYEYYYIDYKTGGTDASSGPFLTAYDKETITDMVTPNFKKKRREGATIVNPMVYQRDYLESTGSGSASYLERAYANGPVVSEWNSTGPLTKNLLDSGYIPDINVDVSTQMSGARRAAILSALSGIDKPALATGEDVLELRQTLQFLRSPLRSIAKELSKRNIHSLKALSAGWLTYRFALSPLIRSVHDILSEIKEPTKRPPDIRVSHGRSSYEAAKQDTHTFGGPSLNRNALRTFHCTGTYHAAIRYRITDPSYDWKWRYGLRNKDLPLSFWNVVPLSFMVDRVYDVSSMIAAARVLVDPSVQILGSSLTLRQTKVKSYTLVSQSSNAPSNIVQYSGRGETVGSTNFYMERVPFSPSLGDVFPKPPKPSGLVSDITKTADLLALISVRIK